MSTTIYAGDAATCEQQILKAPSFNFACDSHVRDGQHVYEALACCNQLKGVAVNQQLRVVLFAWPTMSKLLGLPAQHCFRKTIQPNADIPASHWRTAHKCHRRRAAAEYRDFEGGHVIQGVHADSEAVGNDRILVCQVFTSATHMFLEQASHV